MTQEFLIYNGTIKIKLTGNHAYYISRKIKDKWTDWENRPSVTGIGGIKDKSIPLKFWVAKIIAKFLNAILSERNITEYDIQEAKGLHQKRLVEAGLVGTKIHDFIEKYVKGEKPEMPEEQNVLIGVNGFLDWVKKHKVKFLESETILYSKKFDYSGKLDAIAVIDGKKCLVDYKTGVGLYNDVLLQTAAYTKVYEEMTGDKIVGRWAIRIEKRDENEFRVDMDEKGLPNAEYKTFEAVYLDNNKNQLTEDFEAFLGFFTGWRWNKITENFFKEGKLNA